MLALFPHFSCRYGLWRSTICGGRTRLSQAYVVLQNIQ